MIDKGHAQHMTDVAGECKRLNEISQLRPELQLLGVGAWESSNSRQGPPARALRRGTESICLFRGFTIDRKLVQVRRRLIVRDRSSPTTAPRTHGQQHKEIVTHRYRYDRSLTSGRVAGGAQQV
jgi:hypothetical protein